MVNTNKTLRISLCVVSTLALLLTGCQTNNPPATPAEPDPADGSLIHPVDVTLCWCGGDPDPELPFYDVYFGKNSTPPLIVMNTQEESFTIGDLEPNTTYYWKIVAQDAAGDTCCSATWSFTTIAGDPFEPNDWFDEAYGALNFDFSYQGLISDRHDMDFFYFVPINYGKVNITLDNLPADYDLFMFDRSENLIAYSQSGKLEPETITYDVQSWERYYLAVKPCASCDTEKPYSLLLQIDTTSADGDSYEPNDWFDEAYGPIDLGVEYESWIWDYNDPGDFYYFTAPNDGNLYIHLYSLPYDYDLYLFSSYDWEDPIASSMNEYTYDEWIEFNASANDTYYIMIYPYEGSDSTDSYLFEISTYANMQRRSNWLGQLFNSQH